MEESISTQSENGNVACDLCGVRLPVHASYVVRIDVFADPTLPDISGEQLAAFDLDQAMTEVLDAAAGMTADDLQDGVHRRFEYRLCPRCQPAFSANPLGKPRALRAGRN
jgi:hypothetical protein